MRETGAQLHALTGRRGIFDLIATFKSFYRFAPVRHPLVVHDDGSLIDADLRLLDAHLPGVSVLRRSDADRRVIPILKASGFTKLITLREKLVFTLKLIDLRVYAEGRPSLYLDSDILFHRPPHLLFEMLAGATEPWLDRYNEDIMSSYAWTPEQIKRVADVTVHPGVNAGMVCLRRPEYAADLELFETCLTLETPPDRFYYVEQTLNAIDLSAHGAEALPPDYDVCFRCVVRGHYDTWLRTGEGGHQVTSQHYCGGWAQRRYFYRHFIDHVAPALRAGAEPARGSH